MVPENTGAALTEHDPFKPKVRRETTWLLPEGLIVNRDA